MASPTKKNKTPKAKKAAQDAHAANRRFKAVHKKRRKMPRRGEDSDSLKRASE